MPIVIPRNGPIPASVKDTYTKEQREKLWELIFIMNGKKLIKEYLESKNTAP